MNTNISEMTRYNYDEVPRGAGVWRVVVFTSDSITEQMGKPDFWYTNEDGEYGMWTYLVDDYMGSLMTLHSILTDGGPHVRLGEDEIIFSTVDGNEIHFSYLFS